MLNAGVSVIDPGAADEGTPSLLRPLTGQGGIPLGGSDSPYRFENLIKLVYTLTTEMHGIVYENLHKKIISLAHLQMNLQLEHIHNSVYRGLVEPRKNPGSGGKLVSQVLWVASPEALARTVKQR